MALELRSVGNLAVTGRRQRRKVTDSPSERSAEPVAQLGHKGSRGDDPGSNELVDLAPTPGACLSWFL